MKKSELTKLREALKVERELNDLLRQSEAKYRGQWEMVTIKPTASEKQVQELLAKFIQEERRRITLLDLLVEQREPADTRELRRFVEAFK